MSWFAFGLVEILKPFRKFDRVGTRFRLNIKAGQYLAIVEVAFDLDGDFTEKHYIFVLFVFENTHVVVNGFAHHQLRFQVKVPFEDLITIDIEMEFQGLSLIHI